MPRSGVVLGIDHNRRAVGFNEAGAIMPRSGSGRGRLRGAAVSSFNEAGAIMPRSGVVCEQVEA